MRQLRVVRLKQMSGVRQQKTIRSRKVLLHFGRGGTADPPLLKQMCITPSLIKKINRNRFPKLRQLEATNASPFFLLEIK